MVRLSLRLHEYLVNAISIHNEFTPVNDRIHDRIKSVQKLVNQHYGLKITRKLLLSLWHINRNQRARDRITMYSIYAHQIAESMAREESLAKISSTFAMPALEIVKHYLKNHYTVDIIDFRGFMQPAHANLVDQAMELDGTHQSGDDYIGLLEYTRKCLENNGISVQRVSDNIIHVNHEMNWIMIFPHYYYPGTYLDAHLESTIKVLRTRGIILLQYGCRHDTPFNLFGCKIMQSVAELLSAHLLKLNE